MKRSMIAVVGIVAVMLALTGASQAANSVSWGTAGTGASATVEGSAVKLHTDDGDQGSAYARLTIDGGIALNAISSLSYTSQLTAFDGTSCPILEVIFNIDADGDGSLEGTGLAWMTPATSHQPSALGYVSTSDRGDNFLSGDFWPFATAVDGAYVTRDALGSDLYYWSADDARSGFGSYWDSFATVLSSKLPVHDIDVTDKVYSIDFICGTSGNWQDVDVYLSSVALNGTSYVTPEPATMALMALGGIGMLVSRKRNK